MVSGSTYGGNGGGSPNVTSLRGVNERCLETSGGIRITDRDGELPISHDSSALNVSIRDWSRASVQGHPNDFVWRGLVTRPGTAVDHACLNGFEVDASQWDAHLPAVWRRGAKVLKEACVCEQC